VILLLFSTYRAFYGAFQQLHPIQQQAIEPCPLPKRSYYSIRHRPRLILITLITKKPLSSLFKAAFFIRLSSYNFSLYLQTNEGIGYAKN